MSNVNHESAVVESPPSRIPTLPSLTYADIKEARERELVALVVAKFKRTQPPIKREED